MKPFTGVTVSCKFAVLPAVTVAVGEPRVSEKSCPPPDSAMDCGLLAAPSVIVTEAERLPAAPGVNFTPIEQVAATASDDPQVFVTAKSAALEPVAAMLVMLRALFPLFVRVTACAELVTPTTNGANVKLAPESVAVGARTPVPERLID